MLVGVGDGDGVCAEPRDEACFWTWPEGGALAETETDGCTQEGGFWALLWDGTGATGTGGGNDEEVRVGVIAVNIGVWEGVEVEVEVRVVWGGVGEGAVVSGRLGAQNGDSEGGVDDFALGHWGCICEGVIDEDGGEEDERGDLGPKV